MVVAFRSRFLGLEQDSQLAGDQLSNRGPSLDPFGEPTFSQQSPLIKLGGRSRSYRTLDQIGSGSSSGNYQVILSDYSRVNLTLTGLQANADVALLDDHGIAIQHGTQLGTAFESFSLNLAPGVYYVRVYANGGNTPYELDLSSSRINKKTPIITAGLAHDTGDNTVDGVTTDPTIVGNIVSKKRIVKFKAKFENTPAGQYTDIRGTLDHHGHFTLTSEQLKAIYGSDLPNGTHTLRLEAVDKRGAVAQALEYTFTLDTAAPLQPQFTLDRASDSGHLGDSKTTFDQVTLVGQTTANASVTLQGLNWTTLADSTGQFRFANVPLVLGNNTLTVLARDAAGLEGSFTTTIERQTEDKNGIVLDWNQALLQAIAVDKTAPPVAARNMAIVQIAVYDAINTITHTEHLYYPNAITAPTGASPEAAAAQAAYQTLLSLYPAQKSAFDSVLASTLGKVPDGQSEIDGVAVGQAVAAAILALRSNDGSQATVSYTPSNAVGAWKPTAPNYAPALLPQWPYVKPFAMTSDSQFRPAGPPSYTSAQYAADIEQVRRLGGSTSTERTADQTQIALFWADGGGTYTPPGHWNAIAQQIARQQHNTLEENARLFALLDIAVADAGIVAWDAKYTYNQCRPITSIHDTTPGLGWTSDPTWTPFLATPPFPDYISGHSTFSAAASAILGDFYGNSTSFSVTAHPSSPIAGVVRSYSSFSQAAEEAGISRIYGGIHVLSSDMDGLQAGAALGNYVFTHSLA